MNESIDFLDFLSASPSAAHAAHEVGRRLGFSPVDPATTWELPSGGYLLRRGGAIIAWWIPDSVGPDSGVRIIGAHTDSPGFMLKPQPERRSTGWPQAGVEVYGGPLLSSWFDRELCLAGEVVLADGSSTLIRTEPVFRLPRLAIHLDRDAEINRQTHVQPILTLEEATVSEVIAQAAGVAPEDIFGHELILADAQPGLLSGDLLASGRLDNLTSVYAGMRALDRAVTSGEAGQDVWMLAAFDHEEVGSASTRGAAGPLLGEVLDRIAVACGIDPRPMYARSTMVSADAAHAVHPNYPEKHDSEHRPLLNHGPVMKINANQRYASTAATTAMWRRCCAAAGVPTQIFAGNNAVPCGSTIGPISATRLGIDTVDVGIPLLSMHSAREVCGAQDMVWFREALEAYLIDS
ncbi:M18 family aminopeptidase [Corynebacterium sp. zg-331]|uniref:M18 family aminopeptidase n=1 Tax=unclassified Corynebacterium TaxID=2624378 RepID=UPI00128BC0AF|nr:MULTISPECIES: M18 family aminopeptidase [unclassified Corynebacterium]MBC3185562.1 M18 family aminopeptidase [Corynebacterium sp. zg-331]MPV52056.1 M18 family aminopeptidase [Corynebacterium sp. zg331]